MSCRELSSISTSLWSQALDVSPGNSSKQKAWADEVAEWKQQQSGHCGEHSKVLVVLPGSPISSAPGASQVNNQCFRIISSSRLHRFLTWALFLSRRIGLSIDLTVLPGPSSRTACATLGTLPIHIDRQCVFGILYKVELVNIVVMPCSVDYQASLARMRMRGWGSVVEHTSSVSGTSN